MLKKVHQVIHYTALAMPHCKVMNIPHRQETKTECESVLAHPLCPFWNRLFCTHSFLCYRICEAWNFLRQLLRQWGGSLAEKKKQKMRFKMHPSTHAVSILSLLTHAFLIEMPKLTFYQPAHSNRKAQECLIAHQNHLPDPTGAC